MEERDTPAREIRKLADVKRDMKRTQIPGSAKRYASKPRNVVNMASARKVLVGVKTVVKLTRRLVVASKNVQQDILEITEGNAMSA